MKHEAVRLSIDFDTHVARDLVRTTCEEVEFEMYGNTFISHGCPPCQHGQPNGYVKPKAFLWEDEGVRLEALRCEDDHPELMRQS